MKIAFLTPEYPHPKTGQSGGIGTSIKNLAFGLFDESKIIDWKLINLIKENLIWICIKELKNYKEYN